MPFFSNNSFLGNSLVLVGCVKYKAVTVDCVSMAMIEWLAALYLTIALCYMVPVLATLVSQHWVLGNCNLLVLLIGVCLTRTTASLFLEIPCFITFSFSGKVICFLQGNIGFICFLVELSLVEGISIYRVYAYSGLWHVAN